MTFDDIEKVLKDRTDKYGAFEDNCKITRSFKDVIEGKNLEPVVRETLEMILHKVGRVVNGDPTYEDNFIDIIGYCALYIRHLNKNKGE